MRCPHGYDGNQQASADEDESSSCCGAQVTFMDDGRGSWVLCYKCCYATITGGDPVEAIEVTLR